MTDYDIIRQALAFDTRDTEAVSAALEALGRIEKAGEWQPAETAPRNGDEFLGCLYGQVAHEAMQLVVFYDDSSSPFCWCSPDGPHYHPMALTHWRPLPPPPKKEG